MGTRSLIGVQHTDNCIEYVYCHWDGYPQNNGKLLLNHYQSLPKVLNLISLGSFPSLEENSSIIKPYGDDESWEVDSEEDFSRENHGSEYKYLFKGGKWYMCTGSGPFHELKLEHCK